MFLDVIETFYYYDYYQYEMFITSISKHIFGSNGIVTSLLPRHYVLAILLLPINTTAVMKPLLPINQESSV